MATPKSDKEMKGILEGMGSDVATASGDALKEQNFKSTQLN